MNFFAENLKYLIKKSGKKQFQIAEILGLNSTRLSNYSTGISEPDYLLLSKISKYFNVSIDTIILTDLAKNYGNQNNYDSSIETAFYSNKGIPLIPSTVKAGKNIFDIQVMDYEIEHYFTIPILKEKPDFIWQVDGDSMSPSYIDGTFIACKTILSTEIRWEKPYLIAVNHAPMLKRIIPKDESSFCLRSDNPIHRDFDIKIIDITSIAKIICSIRIE
jgi:transcriptional regulator with XRE-family HTH domain